MPTAENTEATGEATTEEQAAPATEESTEAAA